MSTTYSTPVLTTPAQDATLLLGRVLAAAIFILGGYGKLMATAATKAYFAGTGVPLPDLAYWVAVVVELGGGLLFLMGGFTRAVALVLAVFCIATALLAHAKFGDRGQQINFLKNLAMAGGFLAYVACGGGGFSLDRLFRRGAA